MENVCCRSVINGWQSFDEIRQEFFGPAFHKITDLWEWQRQMSLTPELNPSVQ